MNIKPLLSTILLWAAQCAAPANAQDGTGNQPGVFDAWEGNSRPSESENNSYRLGKVITLKVANLDGWLMNEIGAGRITNLAHLNDEQLKSLKEWRKTYKSDLLTEEIRAAVSNATWELIGKLYPVVDGINLPKAHRLNHEKITMIVDKKDTIHYLRYLISRDSSSSEEWKNFLNRSDHSITPTVTLAFDRQGGLPPRQLPSIVRSDTDSGSKPISFVLYSRNRMILCLLLIILILGVLAYLAPKSEILRDTNQPLRPDGTYPWSLSRAQMAFWFMLIITSFLFLWVVNHSFDILNGTALTLIGIGSGTALGAAAISSAARDEQRLSAAEALYGERRRIPWKTLKKQLAADLSSLEEELRTTPDEASLRQAKQAAYSRLKSEEGFFKRGWVNEILYDWMTENDVVSFHRFQILTWTLVLGLVFATTVLLHLEIPEFNTTLLAMTGISAGTYLGFKFPTTKPTNPEKPAETSSVR